LKLDVQVPDDAVVQISEQQIQFILCKAHASIGARRNAAQPLVAEVVTWHRIAMKRSIADTWCSDPVNRLKFEEEGGIEIPQSPVQLVPEYPITKIQSSTKLHHHPQCNYSQQTTQHEAQHETQHETTQHEITQHNTTQHNTTQHNTTQHNTTRLNTTQYDAALRHFDKT
jgi:hypothetical protein